MKPPHRRQFLHLAAGTFALPAVSRFAWSQTYPARPVRIVVGFAAGGTQDVIARLIGQWLAERLGQQFIIENRLGAGGNIGAEAVVRAAADGYTILLVGPPNAINATLYERLRFDFIQDIAPVASIFRIPNVVVVNPSLPVQTIPQLIAYAKANPRKLNMSSAGIGTTQHVSGELFKAMTGVDMTHVPYRGNAPALTDLIGGQVQVMFDNMPTSIEHIRAGRLRALAVTTALRSDVAPELPPVADFVPGYEASAFFGIGAPKKTPSEIIEKLNSAINATLADPSAKAKLADLGGMVIPGSPHEFGKLIDQETEKWAKVIKFAGIKPE
jgi:tripartite-type tricarboxylate transporter receptor subunit TctC